MLKLNGNLLLFEEYPNKETKAKDFEGSINPEYNLLEFRFEDDRDFTKLLFTKKRIDEFDVPCELFIYYMPYSRMDRKIEGDLFTLDYICGFINSLNFSKVVVMEPHSAKTVEFLKRVKPVYPVPDWVPAVVADLNLKEPIQIVFPDKGARARYENKGFSDVVMLEKVRDPFNGILKDMYIKEGIVIPGSTCIILDDLCSKGGTFAWAGSILKGNGAKQVIIIFAHCEETIFEGKILKDDSPIDRVYTTTSMMNIQHPKINYLNLEVEKYVKD